MKVITIILGVLLAAGGVYCMITPIATYATLGWLIGITMIVEGVANIITWNEFRKAGLANGWSLAAAILSFVLGLVLIGSFALQFSIDLFIAYMIAAWLVIGGITRIIAAFSLRKQESLSNVGAGSSGLGLPVQLVEKVPIDGLCGKTDEDNLGFTYAVLDRYLRTGEIDDPETKAKIDRMHRLNLYKLSIMPSFDPGIPAITDN